MSIARFLGKSVLVQDLINKEGYTPSEATRLVDTFVLILWDKITDHKKIKIEGLGTLTVYKRKQRRRIEKNIRNSLPSIVTINKQEYSVRLEKPVDLTYKEK